MAAAAKAALRKAMAHTLKALTPAELALQSAGVLAQLRALPFYATARSASVYLPMDRGCEVDTWPIIEDLLGRGATVAIPRVTGAGPGDMEMYVVKSVDQARALPRTQWGIPEPDSAMAATMLCLTDDPFDIVLVPGVAFDAQCNRLGHGRGYYDTFIARQQAAAVAAGSSDLPAVVGLALSPQIVARVPTSDHDERLAFVVHPTGRLAYTSAADAAAVAAIDALGSAASARESSASETTSASPSALSDGPPIEARVELATGVYKYACVRVSEQGRGLGRGGQSFLAVRSGRGNYHSDVARPMVNDFRGEGLSAEALGGGRIRFDDDGIFIYGYSVGFGGSEGGPPGRGMSDHAAVARLVRRRYPSVTVTHSPDGY